MKRVCIGYGAEVVGYGVCDDEEYFYDFIDGLYQGLGADVAARDTVRLVQAKGGGYGISRCVSHCRLLHCVCLRHRDPSSLHESAQCHALEVPMTTGVHLWPFL